MTNRVQWDLELGVGHRLGESDITLDALAVQFPFIARQTLNRTATFTRTRIIERIRDEYNVASGVLRDTRNIRIVPAQNSLTAKVTATGRRLPLVNFGARQTARGVTVLVKKSGGRKLIEHAFIAQMRSGHRGIYVRRGPKIRPTRGRFASTGIERQKIFELFNLSVGEIMLSKDIYAKIEEKIMDYYDEELVRRLGVYLETGS